MCNAGARSKARREPSRTRQCVDRLTMLAGDMTAGPPRRRPMHDSGLRVLASICLAVCTASLSCGQSAVAAPDEELLGKSKGYPAGTLANWYTDDAVRVGSYANLDKLFPNQYHVLHKAETPSPLGKVTAEPSLQYRYGGRLNTIDDYLSRQRVTGLLIIKDGQILVERYQYDRKPTDRLTSNSMAKSLIGIGIGFALADQLIHSLDDRVVEYVPELKGNVYGETKIRNLLRMASGARFTEDNVSRNDDADKFLRLLDRKGSIAAIRAFNTREVPEGERFHYASIETQVLTVVLRAATGKTVSHYLADRLWRPMGAESDATWIVAPDGLERGAAFFNATLRDWGRLGRLLANDGALDGKQIIPAEYLVEATDWHQHPAAFAPKMSPPANGYGYQFWTMCDICPWAVKASTVTAPVSTPATKITRIVA